MSDRRPEQSPPPQEAPPPEVVDAPEPEKAADADSGTGPAEAPETKDAHDAGAEQVDDAPEPTDARDADIEQADDAPEPESEQPDTDTLEPTDAEDPAEESEETAAEEADDSPEPEAVEGIDSAPEEADTPEPEAEQPDTEAPEPASADGSDSDPSPTDAPEPTAGRAADAEQTDDAPGPEAVEDTDGAPEETDAPEPEAEQRDAGAPEPVDVADADSETGLVDAQDAGAEQADDAPEPAAGGPDLLNESRGSTTDASGLVDEAPDPVALTDASEVPVPEPVAETVPERAEAAKPPAGALDLADEAPEPTAPIDPPEQSALVDEASDAAVEASEQADDAPEPPADAVGSVDEAPERYGNDALRDGPSYEEEIGDQLGARGLDRSEHDKLRLSRTNELSEAQAREVVGVRDTIKLGEGRMVTKVITPEFAQAYLKNATKLGEDDFNPGEFRGSIARGCDTANLRSMDQLRDGLALDDGGAGWTPVPPSASEAYQLRFPAPHDMRAEPSLGAVGDQGLANHVADMAGQSRGRAWRDPFLGTGYTGGGVPEWSAEPTGFPHHAEIWRMHADGAEEAVGFFDKNERLWKKI
ncbi:hypothetical protein GO001_18430 [Streptomyces sp. NRRL B-1677]|uniref:hypothetical protein n=1 Tax=Streptomyces sp. NRRL B-1677 TaxID=2682966 RepID=UPI001892A964|nr:hypothetical protein [Streptomyces sp. NRRL B-1677]MBF6047192.1 hypothetical protein [Streptomyces sp. NRRL B-1677]